MRFNVYRWFAISNPDTVDVFENLLRVSSDATGSAGPTAVEPLFAHLYFDCALYGSVIEPVKAVAAVQRNAELSFLVRYWKPIAGVVAFHRRYIQNHPPILARFPAVRNVRC